MLLAPVPLPYSPFSILVGTIIISEKIAVFLIALRLWVHSTWSLKKFAVGEEILQLSLAGAWRKFSDNLKACLPIRT